MSTNRPGGKDKIKQKAEFSGFRGGFSSSKMFNCLMSVGAALTEIFWNPLQSLGEVLLMKVSRDRSHQCEVQHIGWLGSYPEILPLTD